MTVVLFLDALCVEKRRHPNQRVALSFEEYENQFMRCIVSHDQIIIPHAFEERVLCIYQYPRLVEHPKQRNVCQCICRDMYWPTCSRLLFSCLALPYLRKDLRSTTSKCPTSAAVFCHSTTEISCHWFTYKVNQKHLLYSIFADHQQ